MIRSIRQSDVLSAAGNTARRALHSTRTPWLLGAGVALAAMGAYVQYRTRKAEQDAPPAEKFIDVDGVRLHYLERGKGQPVVLLHGNGAMAKELEISGLVDLAAENYRVIAFDRPGYGYSERPRTQTWNPMAQAKLLHRALLQLGIEQPVVVGHSWATMVAISLALQHPEYVRGLLLLSGYYYPTARLDVPLFSLPALPVIGGLMRYTAAPLLGRLVWPAMVRKLFAPADTPQRFHAEYPVWLGLRPVPLRAAAEEVALMIPSAYKLVKRYRELKMPVTIMAGADDLHVLPKLHSERLHQELPQSELILVPAVGHMIQHTAPEKVLEALDRMASTVAWQESGRGAVATYPDSEARQVH
ncbi:MAG TPA: alpha/beta hydrolase [Oxalobacteraceae bacterium]|nr:alpha/beta hydrolase [Oxalobacteraceae bacterium]